MLCNYIVNLEKKKETKKNKTKQNKNLYIYYGVQYSFIFCECSERRKASRVTHSSSQKTGLYRVLPWSLR